MPDDKAHENHLLDQCSKSRDWDIAKLADDWALAAGFEKSDDETRTMHEALNDAYNMGWRDGHAEPRPDDRPAVVRAVKYFTHAIAAHAALKLPITGPSRIWISNKTEPNIPRQGEEIDLADWCEERPMSAMATGNYWQAWMHNMARAEIVICNLAARWLMVESGDIS